MKHVIEAYFLENDALKDKIINLFFLFNLFFSSKITSHSIAVPITRQTRISGVSRLLRRHTTFTVILDHVPTNRRCYRLLVNDNRFLISDRRRSEDRLFLVPRVIQRLIVRHSRIISGTFLSTGIVIRARSVFVAASANQSRLIVVGTSDLLMFSVFVTNGRFHAIGSSRYVFLHIFARATASKSLGKYLDILSFLLILFRATLITR